MIPKTIWTTWVSNKPLPDKFNQYIDSWKKVMPDYEIKVISLNNIKRGPFVDKAIASGKYILAGHYARCQEIYENGGLYFDIDVEAIKKFDDLLNNKMIIAKEDANFFNNAIFGTEKEHPFMKACMDFMDQVDLSMKEIELETGPRMFTNLISGRNDYTLLPTHYFYPYLYTQEFTPECIKSDTYAIHHWAHSWNNGVSIIIPCFNQAQFLPDAIMSALNQTVPPLEIIVVNDGSPDNTSAVAKKYPVKLIEQENRGLSGARNSGIRASKGNWLLMLDADDKIAPDFIEKLIGKDDIICPILQEFGDSQEVWSPPLDHPKFNDFLVHNRIFVSSLFKRDVWEKIGGYDETMKEGYEDWDFWMRATKQGFNISVVREILFYYRRHGRTMVHDARAKHQQIVNYMLNKNR